MKSLRRSITPLLLGTLLAVVVANTSAGAQNRREAMGLNRNHVVSGDTTGEFIDHQTGALNLTIPIGPSYQIGPRLSYQLTLHYGSFIWIVVDHGLGGVSELRRESPFGLGFDLHMGRIVVVGDTPTSSGYFAYVSPDGAKHHIEKLASGVSFDGSNIRTSYDSANDDWWLEFPNGISAHFSSSPSEDDTYRLDELRAPEEIPDAATGQPTPAAAVYVLYGPAQNPPAAGTWRCIDKITDSLGREFRFSNQPTIDGGRTEAIERWIDDGTGTGNKVLDVTWTFSHATGQRIYSPSSAPPEYEDGVDLLTAVTFPAPGGVTGDAMILDFGYGDDPADPSYSGIIRKRYLPHQVSPPPGATLRFYEYTYAETFYRQWERNTTLHVWELRFRYNTAVVEKKLQPTGSEWTWDRTWDLQTGDIWSVKFHNPDDNMTLYEFAHDTPSPDEWQDGLPTRTQWYAGKDGFEQLLLGEETREYKRRTDSGTFAPIHVSRLTRSIEGPGQLIPITTQRLGVDEYGRFSDVIVESPGGLYRRAHVDWTTPGSADPWFLGGWSRKILYDELGRPFSESTAGLSPTGLLISHRQMAVPGGQLSGNDVHVLHEYDIDSDPNGFGWGLRTKSTRTGGDPGGHDYVTSYEYEHNTYLARAESLASGDPGAALSSAWYAMDQKFDVITGLMTQSLDPNEKKTTYQRDKLGRPVLISPPNEPPILITYETLRRTRVEQCKTPVTECRVSIYKYDDLGRLEEVRQSDMDGNFNARRTSYDWAGRVTKQSEWFACDELVDEDCALTLPATIAETIVDYTRASPAGTTDPFGRPRFITAADGATTVFTHTDTYRTATVNVNGWDSKTHWFFDAFGRLTNVDSPEGADAGYLYDLAGRLIRAELSDPNGPATTQIRSFAYDAIGRVRSSTTPEGGTVQVVAYDASGKPFHTRDARGREVWITYDDAGRVLEVMDITGFRNILMARNTYDGGEPSQAKLIRTEAWDEWGIPVVETNFVYSQTTSRLETQRTKFAAWFSRTDEYEAFDEVIVDYSYDAWGELSGLRYPVPSSFALDRATNGIADLTYERKNGWLWKVTDASRGTTLLDVTQYNAAGGPRRWQTGNLVVTDIFPDVRFRPERILVNSGSTELWNSGDYSYDAAGNITGIGTDDFDYDLLGRLKRAAIDFDDGSGMATYVEDYTYDAFGNLKTKVGSGAHTGSLALTVDSNTNRILDSEGTYAMKWDPSGNLVEDPTLFAGPPSGPHWEAALLQYDGRGRLKGIAKRLVGPSGQEPGGLWEEQFHYDASGLRVVRSDAQTGLTTFYIRDISGQVLSEFVRPTDSELLPAWSRDTFYGLGGTLAVAEAEDTGPPTGLRATVAYANPDYDVTLDWKAVAGADDYRVYRNNSNSPVVLSGAPASTAYGFQWTGTVPAGTEYYWVSSVANLVEGERSRIIRIDPGGAVPPAVTGLVSDRVGTTIRINWDRIAGFDEIVGNFREYIVERIAPGDAWEVLTPLPLREPFFVDPDPPAVPFGAYLQYKVRAVDNTGAEDASPPTVLAALPQDPFPPSAPGGVFASSGPDPQEASIAWDRSLEDDVIQYYVYSWDSAVGIWNIVAGIPALGDTTFTLTGLPERVPVTLAVSAMDSWGESPLSEPVTIRPALSTTELAPPAGLGASRSGGTATVSCAGGDCHVYRRQEGGGHVMGLRNGTPVFNMTDTGLDSCHGYVYTATASETVELAGVALSTGDESGISEKRWVEPWLAPAGLSIAIDGLAGLDLSWDGSLVQCEGGDFTIGTYYFMMITEYNVIPVQIGSSSTLNEVINYPLAGDGGIFWVEAEFQPTADEDPAEVMGFGPRRTTSREGRVCADLTGPLDLSECAWEPEPTPSTGGPGPEEPPEKPKLRKIVELSLPETEMPYGLEVAGMSQAVEVAWVNSGFCEESVQVPAARQPSENFSHSFASHEWSEAGYIVIGQSAPSLGSPADRGIRVTYLHSDHLGTTRLRTVANGAEVFKSASMPFGESLSTESSLTDFAGHSRSDDSEATYMVARYYSATSGRFLSPDPVLGHPDDSQSWNRFGYVRSNPVNLIDPLGLFLTPGTYAPDHVRDRSTGICYLCTVDVKGSGGTMGIQDLEDEMSLGLYIDSKGELQTDLIGPRTQEQQALEDAIADSGTITLIMEGQDNGFLYATTDGKGTHTIDLADTFMLSGSTNNSSLTAGSVVFHEIVEGLAENNPLLAGPQGAHAFANRFAPGLSQNPDFIPTATQGGLVLAADLVQTVRDGSGTLLITSVTFSPPMPWSMRGGRWKTVGPISSVRSIP